MARFNKPPNCAWRPLTTAANPANREISALKRLGAQTFKSEPERASPLQSTQRLPETPSYISISSMMSADMDKEDRLRILLIGNGGREHALAWKLAQSPSVEAIYTAPGS